MKPHIVFITGTDTGVGKTLLTALLLDHLRMAGRQALAMKPFCSGGTADVDLLFRLQNGDLTRPQINPFYFPEPVAPMVSSRMHNQRIRLEDAVAKVHAIASRCEVLLVEGSGGLMVPLAKDYTVLDLISRIQCASVVLVSRNRLGTINHTLLSMAALRAAQLTRITTVLMDVARPDFSSRSNPLILKELLNKMPLIRVPHLGPRANTFQAVKKKSKSLKKTLARIL